MKNFADASGKAFDHSAAGGQRLPVSLAIFTAGDPSSTSL